MRFWCAVIIAAFAGAFAFAQDAPAPAPAAPADAPAPAAEMGSYDKMEIEHVGLMDGTLDGRINKMSGGVKIKLIAGKPDMKDLPIKAQTMTFSYK